MLNQEYRVEREKEHSEMNHFVTLKVAKYKRKDPTELGKDLKLHKAIERDVWVRALESELTVKPGVRPVCCNHSCNFKSSTNNGICSNLLLLHYVWLP